MPGGDAERWRLFVAVDLPDAMADLLEPALRSLDSLDTLVRRSQLSGIHLTLAFLGMVDTSRVPEIQDRLQVGTSGVERFTVDIGGAGVFPSPSRPQVLWVGIGGAARPQLLGLAAGVAAQLRQAGFELEERAFRPHLTLGRIRARPRPAESQALRQWLADWRDRPLGRLQVTAVSLMRSQLSKGPPVYTRLQTFGLQ
jgi:RNA 2',3'-cyclic 3'-phosphodiesterase